MPHVTRADLDDAMHRLRHSMEQAGAPIAIDNDLVLDHGPGGHRVVAINKHHSAQSTPFGQRRHDGRTMLSMLTFAIDVADRMPVATKEQ